MRIHQSLRPYIAPVALAGIVLGGLVIRVPSTRADNGDDNNENSKIQQGFNIAPVHLNLTGKNRSLVGLGCYIVNAQAECNGCHSAGPATQYSPGGNPYFGQAEKTNPATYLGGGRDFGAFPSDT